MKFATLLLAPAALAAAGCSSPSEQPQTALDLLRAGDVKVCVAPDVENTVRGMILPKNTDTTGYTLSFSETTLESFDKAVTKAACNANLRVEGPDGEIVPRTSFDYAIKPSAQDPSTFVISLSGTSGITAQIATTINDAQLSRQAAAEQQARDSALAAMVKAGWLIGRWVDASKGSSACYEGPYIDFGRNHRLGDGGRWQLAGLQLDLVTASASISETITAADMASFTSEGADGTETSYRRCTRDDMAQPASPYATSDGSDEPAPSSVPTGMP